MDDTGAIYSNDYGDVLVVTPTRLALRGPLGWQVFDCPADMPILADGWRRVSDFGRGSALPHDQDQCALISLGKA